MESIRKNKFFVLAGTSGTGKTSVLQYLSSLQYNCVEEAARSVLTEQLATDGPALPSKDPMLFIERMPDRCVDDFLSMKPKHERCFFDRGMPDLVHYARRFNVDASPFVAASQKYLYNKRVFFFPPWEEIFVNNNERRMSFEKSVEFSEILIKAYSDCGYQLLEVSCLSILERAQFILQNAVEGV